MRIKGLAPSLPESSLTPRRQLRRARRSVRSWKRHSAGWRPWPAACAHSRRPGSRAQRRQSQERTRAAIRRPKTTRIRPPRRRCAGTLSGSGRRAAKRSESKSRTRRQRGSPGTRERAAAGSRERAAARSESVAVDSIGPGAGRPVRVGAILAAARESDGRVRASRALSGVCAHAAGGLWAGVDGGGLSGVLNCRCC
jgi:hypothetical protein